jgi:hypothetical protein
MDILSKVSKKISDYFVLHNLKLILLNIRIHLYEYRPDSGQDLPSS